MKIADNAKVKIKKISDINKVLFNPNKPAPIAVYPMINGEKIDEPYGPKHEQIRRGFIVEYPDHHVEAYAFA